jgi:hypothetical protein
VQDAPVSRLRSVIVLTILALLVGGLAVAAVADPFHLRYARWFTSGLVLLTLLLLTALLAVIARRGVLRVLALVVGGIAVMGWIAVVWLASQLDAENRVVAEVADGGRRLVVVEGSPIAIDPVFAVVLRAGNGPFEQESLVYQGLEEMPEPSAIRFVDPSTVEVQMGSGCRYRSEVEAVTMAIEPVHRPLRIDGC